MHRDIDAFIAAVDDGLEQLSREEGRRVSVRELCRRVAPDDDAIRSRLLYHLNHQKDWGPRGHRVPLDLVPLLASVLPIEEADLARAAQVAAGFDVRLPLGEVSPLQAVVRFCGDAEVSEADKDALRQQLLRFLADDMSRPRLNVS